MAFMDKFGKLLAALPLALLEPLFEYFGATEERVRPITAWPSFDLSVNLPGGQNKNRPHLLDTAKIQLSLGIIKKCPGHGFAAL